MQLTPLMRIFGTRLITVEKTTSSTQRDLGKGQISIALMYKADILSTIVVQNCHANRELHRIQRWILFFLPDTAVPYLFPKIGYLTQLLGEGLLVHACTTTIFDYTVSWNSQHNNTCYHTFPVKVASTEKMYFLVQQNVWCPTDKQFRTDCPIESYISDR